MALPLLTPEQQGLNRARSACPADVVHLDPSGAARWPSPTPDSPSRPGSVEEGGDGTGHGGGEGDDCGEGGGGASEGRVDGAAQGLMPRSCGSRAYVALFSARTAGTPLWVGRSRSRCGVTSSKGWPFTTSPISIPRSRAGLIVRKVRTTTLALPGRNRGPERDSPTANGSVTRTAYMLPHPASAVRPPGPVWPGVCATAFP